MSENYFYSSLSAQEIEDTLVGAVVYNSDQALTTSQKAQARANIGAGENDTKVIILGFFDTLADLQSQIPVGTAGDVYAVGTQSPYDIYIWDATHTEWKDNGPLSFSDAIIDDGDISLSSTWSSQKINTQISAIDLTSLISDSTTASNKTWSSNKISTELSGKATPSDVAALVDDSTTSASKTWSSQKIAAEIAKCKWKLLWTNQSPSSSFSPQTIPLDLSAYSEVRVLFYNGATSTAQGGYVDSMIGGPTVTAMRFSNLTETGQTALYIRQFTATSTGVTFDGSYEKQTYSPWTATNQNSTQVPMYIYAR